MPLSVTKVHFMSAAFRAGLRKGDVITAFDGYPYQDALDFAYYDGQSEFDVTFLREGTEHKAHLRKEDYQPMGIEYESVDMPIKPCTNRCIFCFVEQCPKGMRPSLYVKDDDYRTSFACGSYVTLSNLKEEDVERILRLGLSPLYVSVHAYDPDVKKLLCANPQSTKVFEYMRRFAERGIDMHTQIVMVEGINDGEVLRETLVKLYELTPHVRSVAVVPVGLTEHREGLYPLHPVGKRCAAETVRMVEEMQAMCVEALGTHWVWCSDEMYILADLPMPKYETYEDFVQIENGVGMVSTFLREADEALAANPRLSGKYTLVTGVAFAGILEGVVKRIADGGQPVELDVAVVKNDWFGKTVTVAGLLTGGDIVKQLKARGYHKDVILPDTTLKEFESVLLDGMSVADLERELDCRIHICEGGGDLIGILAHRKERNE